MNNGPQPSAEHGGAAGTEYTLQGVMRFLQIEWHNHERLRNAWDIERDEMKQKIAKQEGANKKLKRMNEVLEKHVKILEKSLKEERAKKKVVSAQELLLTDEQAQRDPKGKAAAKTDGKSSVTAPKPPYMPHNSFLDADLRAPESENDVQLEKSRKYLTKCVEEITYLLLPPSHPPPPSSGLPSLANSSSYLYQPDAPMTMEEVFIQQRQKTQQLANAGLGQPMPNHQPPPVPSAPEAQQLSQAVHQPLHQAELMSREPSLQPQYSHSQSFATTPYSGAEGHTPGFSSGTEEPLGKILQNFEQLGRPAGPREVDTVSSIGGRQTSDASEGFVFEESHLGPEATPEGLPSGRPDQDHFPSANSIPVRSPPRTAPTSHRRRSSGSVGMVRRRSQEHEPRDTALSHGQKPDPQQFRVRYALRGHFDVVRSVIFTGGGSPAEPEICTAGDDGMIKRWIVPASYGIFSQHGMSTDLDIQSYFTHRGHDGVVTSLAACPATTTFSTGGRVSGDGWIFSGGQDATVRVWERGRVDPKATLEGHTDAVWAVCVLPATSAAVFGQDCNNFGGPDRVLLASGSADGTIKLWAVSAPPQLASPQTGSRRGVGGSRRHSVTSGSNYPSSPQPSVATSTPFHHTLVHSIERAGLPSPTCISPLSMVGETFVVSYNDASVLIFDTRTGEEIIGMASTETYDGTPASAVNAVVATAVGLDGSMSMDSGRPMNEEDSPVHGATGSTADGGVEGIVISGHEDQFIRFFDANSGQCTYSMLAHPSAISSLSVSKDGREAVSAGHDASIRFWSLEKRVCTQMITSHRIMRGEGVCSVVWSQDGRLVVSAGGDGVVKVFAR